MKASKPQGSVMSTLENGCRFFERSTSQEYLTSTSTWESKRIQMEKETALYSVIDSWGLGITPYYKYTIDDNCENGLANQKEEIIQPDKCNSCCCWLIILGIVVLILIYVVPVYAMYLACGNSDDNSC